MNDYLTHSEVRKFWRSLAILMIVDIAAIVALLIILKKGWI